MSKGLYTALHDLHLAHLWVVYPGARRYALAPRVTALPVAEIGATWRYANH